MTAQPIKPYSESCEQNQAAILAVIQPLLKSNQQLLEIGSGTGQHAVFFAKQMTHLKWQTADQVEYHQGIKQWLAEANLPNIQAPLVLDVLQADWIDIQVDSVFSANTAHIMNKEMAKQLIIGVAKLLPSGGKFLLYGPFNYNREYTSKSNQQFDLWLKEKNKESGIKDFEYLNQFAVEHQMTLIKDYPMLANNRILYWQKN